MYKKTYLYITLYVAQLIHISVTHAHTVGATVVLSCGNVKLL